VSYGEAYPVHRIARSLDHSEALIGQLYRDPDRNIGRDGLARTTFNAALKETDFRKSS